MLNKYDNICRVLILYEIFCFILYTAINTVLVLIGVRSTYFNFCYHSNSKLNVESKKVICVAKMTDDEREVYDIDKVDYKDLKYYCRNAWIRIGMLNEICVYPIETGHGFNVKKAICTKNGLQTFSLSKKNPKSESEFRYSDRTFVPYKSAEGGYSRLSDSSAAECCDKAVFHNAQKIASRLGKGYRSKIDYLGSIIKLFEVNCNLKDSSGEKVGEIGYIPPEDRKTFLSHYRSSNWENLKDNIFLPNFYPYTLINTTSLDSLQEENGYSKTISPEKFAPNFIIEANEPYCEDEIVALRIGDKARFSNVVPCTHLLEECDYDCMSKAEQKEFLNNLQKKRSLQNVHPYLSMSSDVLTVFGINLDIVEQGEIRLYDDVFAKFREPPKSDEDDMDIEDEEITKYLEDNLKKTKEKDIN